MTPQGRMYIGAAAVGVAVGISVVALYHRVDDYIDASRPVVELIAWWKERSGDSVNITLSGRQLRDGCTYVGMQAFSAPLGSNKRFPATLTWLTPSADISRKRVGPLFDLGVWRVQPVPVGLGIVVEETNICGSSIVNDQSKVVKGAE